MKKILFAILIAAVVSGPAVAIDKTRVNAQIMQSFEKEFSGASFVTWEALSGRDIYHASFIYNNEKREAYFDTEGTLLVTGRIIKLENLPMLVSKTLNGKYGGYSVLESSELNSGSGTSYLVRLENEKCKLMVRVYTDGSSWVVKKEKKNKGSKL